MFGKTCFAHSRVYVQDASIEASFETHVLQDMTCTESCLYARRVYWSQFWDACLARHDLLRVASMFKTRLLKPVLRRMFGKTWLAQSHVYVQDASIEASFETHVLQDMTCTESCLYARRVYWSQFWDACFARHDLHRVASIYKTRLLKPVLRHMFGKTCLTNTCLKTGFNRRVLFCVFSQDTIFTVLGT
jgi:hypothetical protein